MNTRAVRYAVVLLCFWFGAGAAPVADPPKTDGTEPAAPSPHAYVPPRLGSPENRVSGATRGPEALQLSALAPSDVGLTAREQPTLYWYNSRPILGRASLLLTEDISNRVVLRATVPVPLPAGINSFPLSGSPGRLRRDITYRWSLTVVATKQDTSPTAVAGGLIERVQPATRHLWYDEVDSVSQAIRRAPGDRSLREERSVLLDRASLADVAALDRAAVQAEPGRATQWARP